MAESDQPQAKTWREFFDEHAPRYMENPFTKDTLAEVQFLIDKLALQPPARVLDIGCGTGRHAIELALRGFEVVGLDLSEGMIAEARKAAGRRGASVEWIVGDAREFDGAGRFDAVLCLCEGGLGLANLDDDPILHDLKILQSAFSSLRPGGGFLATALNGYALIRRMTDEDVERNTFDPTTMLARYVDEWELPEGRVAMMIRERLLIPPEMVAMLRHVGFEVLHVWGGTAGDWGERPVKLDEVEAMYICKRPELP